MNGQLYQWLRQASQEALSRKLEELGRQEASRPASQEELIALRSHIQAEIARRGT